MYTVMITGGLASGKSTLRRILCEKGAVSIDLDQINATLLQGNRDYIGELVARFGEDILDPEGCVVPARLAQAAFATEADTADLNAIAFPYITAAANEYILDVHCTPRSDAKVLVIEVPLLNEVPEFAKLADEVVAVTAPSDARLARAVARGMDGSDALARLQRQASDAERVALADTVCENAGDEDDLHEWVDAWWDATMTKLADEKSRG